MIKLNLEIVKIIDKYVGVPICIALIIFDRVVSLFKRKTKPIEQSKVKKILIIRLFGFGNLVLALPSFKKISEMYLSASITLLTVGNNKGLLEEANFIDKVVYFNVKNINSFISSFIKLFFYLRKQKFDIILDYDIFARISTIFSYLLGAKLRCGIAIPFQMRAPLYNIVVDYNNNQHISRTFYDMADCLGASKIKKVNLVKIPGSNSDKIFIKNFLREKEILDNDKLIGIHVGSGDNFIGRRWPELNFARVADYLIEKYKCRILFTGTEKEHHLINKTIKFMKHKNHTLIMKECNLRQLALIIERCDMFMSTDTGPLHLSSAMNTPSVSFYGPNTPVLYGPLGNKKNLSFYEGIKCSPCITNFNAKSTKCNNAICLKKITPDKVIRKIDKNLKEILES